MSNGSKNPAGEGFTNEMRDEQARGKDPYGSQEETKTTASESFASQEKRYYSSQMLDSPESLMNEALRTGNVSLKPPLFPTLDSS